MKDPSPNTQAQIQWSTFEPEILEGYRHDYRLSTPAAFNKQYNQLVLSSSPIGRMSPTMARQKQRRRQGQDQLANTVRKHFNSMGIIENEVIVDFLYKVRWQGRCSSPERLKPVLTLNRQEFPDAIYPSAAAIELESLRSTLNGEGTHPLHIYSAYCGFL